CRRAPRDQQREPMTAWPERRDFARPAAQGLVLLDDVLRFNADGDHGVASAEGRGVFFAAPGPLRASADGSRARTAAAPRSPWPPPSATARRRAAARRTPGFRRYTCAHVSALAGAGAAPAGRRL